MHRVGVKNFFTFLLVSHSFFCFLFFTYTMCILVVQKAKSTKTNFDLIFYYVYISNLVARNQTRPNRRTTRARAREREKVEFLFLPHTHTRSISIYVLFDIVSLQRFRSPSRGFTFKKTTLTVWRLSYSVSLWESSYLTNKIKRWSMKRTTRVKGKKFRKKSERGGNAAFGERVRRVTFASQNWFKNDEAS